MYLLVFLTHPYSHKWPRLSTEQAEVHNHLSTQLHQQSCHAITPPYPKATEFLLQTPEVPTGQVFFQWLHRFSRISHWNCHWCPSQSSESPTSPSFFFFGFFLFRVHISTFFFFGKKHLNRFHNTPEPKCLKDNEPRKKGYIRSITKSWK